MRALLFVLLVLPLSSSGRAGQDDRISWRWDKEGSFCTLNQLIPGRGTLSLGRGPGSDATSISFPVDRPVADINGIEGGVVRLSNGKTSTAVISASNFPNGERWLSAEINGRGFLADLNGATSLQVEHPGIGRHDVVLRDAGAAATALASCEDRTLAQWGVDPRTYWSLKARPIPLTSPMGLFTADDYPASGQKRNVESTVIAQLDVGPDGRVLKCKTISRHKFTDFPDVVCRRLEGRARFAPAQDSSGQPVSAPFIVVVRFRLM